MGRLRRRGTYDRLITTRGSAPREYPFGAGRPVHRRRHRRRRGPRDGDGALGRVRPVVAPAAGPAGFLVAVSIGPALGTFLVVYGRRVAPPDLLRPAAVSLLLGLACGTLSFAVVSMLSGIFAPASVPLWVPLLAVALAPGSFLASGVTVGKRGGRARARRFGQSSTASEASSASSWTCSLAPAVIR